MRFEPFFRCRDCGLVAETASAEYSTKHGEADWERPVRVRCAICGAQQLIAEDDVLAKEHMWPCRRCHAVTACPDSAARVRCCGCGVMLVGPGAVEARCREDLLTSEGLHALELNHALEQAKKFGYPRG